jgi:competence protein ComFC
MGVLDLLFPKQCFNCKKYGSYLCKNCVPPPIIKQKCIVCEKWAIDGFTHPRCEGPYTIDRILSIWDYTGAIRRAIISLKYKFAAEIAKELAGHCARALNLNPQGEALRSFSLVPIPMHWQRENWRGFNQVEEIGKSLSQSLGLGWEQNMLLRTQRRKPQVALNQEQRARNIKDAFSLNSNYERQTMNKENILLFDDVYTTGATLKEAGKVLKKAGVKKVWAVTIAR